MTDGDAPRGIFDSFETYRTPTPDDYRRLLTEGLVVPDANVRSTATTATVPHRVCRHLGENSC